MNLKNFKIENLHMDKFPEYLKDFMPENLSQDDFRHCPPSVQQIFIDQAQAAYNMFHQNVAEVLNVFEELVPDEFFNNDYVYEEFDPIVGEELVNEMAPVTNHIIRSTGTFRGHPKNLRALIRNQIELGNQIRFDGTMDVRDNGPKAFRALFYNMFHLLRLTFNELTTNENDVLFEGTYYIAPNEHLTNIPNQHNRSRIGQGKDLYDLKEYEDDLVYIPSSGLCFAKCIEYLYGEEYKQKYLDFALKEKIFKDKFPQCKIQRFNEIANIRIGVYDEKKQHVRHCKDYEYVIALCEGHYIVLKGTKGSRNFSKGYKIAQEKIKWEEKQITNEMLQNVKEVKAPRLEDFNIFEDTFLWDCETTPDEETFESKVYGAAFIPMMELEKVSNILNKISNANPEEIKTVEKIYSKIRVFNDIQHMINAIACKYRNKPPSNRHVNGSLMNKDIYFYAHNAAKFDNYLLMILKYVSFKDILITGRGLVRLTTRHFLRQEDRVVKRGKDKGKIISDKQYLNIHWCCSMSFMLGSLKNLCTSYKIPPELAKSSMDHTMVTAETVELLRPIWVPYLKGDVLSLAICFYLYSKSIYDNMCTSLDDKGNYNGISLNSCVSNSTLAWKGFLKDYFSTEGEIEPIYTYEDENIEKFIRKTVYGGRVAALNNKFEAEGFSTELLPYLFKAYDVENLNDLEIRIEKIRAEIKREWEKGAYMKISFDKYYSTEFLRLYPAEAKFMKEFIKDKELLYSADAVSLYPSVQVIEEQWPRADSGRLMTKEEKPSIIEEFNSGTFFPRIGYFHLTIETPTNNFLSACASRTEHGNVLAVGKITDYYNSVDIEQMVFVNGSKVLDIHFGIIYDKNYKTPIFRPFINKQFALRKKAKAEGNDVSQMSTKQTMCSLYGKQVQNPIKETWCIETEKTLKRNFDHKYLDVIKLNNGSYACKKIQEKLKFMPSYHGSLQLAYSRKLVNKFIIVIDGFKTMVIYYMDTDSLYIKSSDYALLKEAGYIGSEMGQCKNDYGEGGIVFARFIANKIKFCMTITEDGVPDFHKTFKGHDNLTGLSYDDYEKMINGESLEEVISRWDRSLEKGILIKENNMSKKFDPYVNFVRREKPDKDGWMKPIGYTL